MAEPTKLPPPSVKAPESEGKEALEDLDEVAIRELMKLIPSSFNITMGKEVSSRSKAQVVKDLFLTDENFREFAHDVIAQSVEKAEGMTQQEKRDLVTKDLVAALTPKYENKVFLVKLKKIAAEDFVKLGPLYNTLTYVGLAGERYLAHRTKAGEINVYVITKDIGQGGTSTVHKVVNLAKEGFYALKLSKKVPPVGQVEKRAGVQNRFTKAAEKASVVYQTTLLIGHQTIGYLMPLYRDLISALTDDQNDDEFPPEVRQDLVHQAIKQHFALIDKGRWNVDLKPDNIMLDEEAESGESLKMVDLDDALDFSCLDTPGMVDIQKLNALMEEIRTSGEPFGAGTTRYMSEADLKEMMELRRQLKTPSPPAPQVNPFPELTASSTKEEIENTLNFLDKYRTALERRLIFALGATCFTIMTNDIPYPLKSRADIQGAEFPNLDSPKKAAEYDQVARVMGCSEQMIGILRKMMIPIPSERPSRKEVEAAFKTK